MRRTFLLVLVAAICFSAVPAHAVAILPNTGTGAAGAVDPYWKIYQFPGVNPEDVSAILPAGAEIPAYRVTTKPIQWLTYPDGPFWIAPQAESFGFTNAWGTYVYRTWIDLSDYQPNTVDIWGVFSSDNCAPQIRVNGIATSAGNVPNGCPEKQTGFNFGPAVALEGPDFGTVPFIRGLNTIDFVVLNSPCPGCAYNPTGIVVRWDGYWGIEVPEPATFALGGLALALLALARRRRTA